MFKFILIYFIIGLMVTIYLSTVIEHNQERFEGFRKLLEDEIALFIFHLTNVFIWPLVLMNILYLYIKSFFIKEDVNGD